VGRSQYFLDYCTVLFCFGSEPLLHANPQVNTAESAYDTNDAEGVSKWLHNVTEEPL
jgi:hypothetical protein